MTGADLSACEDRLYALLAAHRPRYLRLVGRLLEADQWIVALLRKETL